MTIIINRTNCVGTAYENRTDCPLFHAIKEQFPEFPLKYVGGYEIIDKDGNEYPFNSDVWNSREMEKIQSNLIPRVELYIKTN